MNPSKENIFNGQQVDQANTVRGGTAQMSEIWECALLSSAAFVGRQEGLVWAHLCHLCQSEGQQQITVTVDFLAVQWLRFCTSTAGTGRSSREPRSHKPGGAAKNNNKYDN